MATIQIVLPPSLPDDPAVVTGIVFLEGARYRFTFRWSPRDDPDGLYHLDISDAAGVLQVAGIPVVASDDLLAPFRYASRKVPPGRLRVTCDPDPATGVPRDPTIETLGREGRVEYVESTDS